MNPTTKTTVPATGPDRFFVKSMDDYTTHATLDDAIREANDRIQDCLCDGWDEDAVRAVEYGAIMGGAAMFNKRPDPEGNFDYLCEYEAAPLQDPGLFAEKGVDDMKAGIFCHVITGFCDDLLESVQLDIKDQRTKIELYAFLASTLLITATKKDAK